MRAVAESNSTKVLDSIPEHLKKKNADLLITIDLSECLKTLGVHWNTTLDSFYIVVFS